METTTTVRHMDNYALLHLYLTTTVMVGIRATPESRLGGGTACRPDIGKVQNTYGPGLDIEPRRRQAQRSGEMPMMISRQAQRPNNIRWFGSTFSPYKTSDELDDGGKWPLMISRRSAEHIATESSNSDREICCIVGTACDGYDRLQQQPEANSSTDWATGSVTVWFTAKF
jgi:hypothetical protein